MDFDLVVIGAGPAGYVASIRAAQLGMKVACIEKEDKLGGTCLRVGCIPSKALLESSEKYHESKEGLAKHGVNIAGLELDLATMLARKDGIVDELTAGIAFLFKKNKVQRFVGTARLLSANKVLVEARERLELNAKNILIATGSKAAQLGDIAFDGDYIGSSTEALSYQEVPEHLVVIGAGVIGLELGSVWRRLGSKVTVVEYLNSILPGMDGDTAKEALRSFKRQGFKFQLGAKVTAAKRTDEGCVVEIEGKDPIACDRVLVAVGRKPNTDGLGLAELGVAQDGRGFIEVDGNYQSNIAGVYAVGDVIGGAMLAHKAEEEAIACVEQMASGYGHVNYEAIPSVVYTEPEIASVGRSEEELKAANIHYKKGIFPYQANGRAKAIGASQGKVKILADAQSDRILGAHIIGTRAGDLIAELAVAMEFKASAEDIARSSHAHPSLAEIVKEAALAVDARAIHI